MRLAPRPRDSIHSTDMDEPAPGALDEPRAAGAIVVCPYLVSAGGPWRNAEPARDHRCARQTHDDHLDLGHQRRYCLGSGGPGCPHYVAPAGTRAVRLHAARRARPGSAWVDAGAWRDSPIGGPGERDHRRRRRRGLPAGPGPRRIESPPPRIAAARPTAVPSTAGVAVTPGTPASAAPSQTPRPSPPSSPSPTILPPASAGSSRRTHLHRPIRRHARRDRRAVRDHHARPRAAERDREPEPDPTRPGAQVAMTASRGRRSALAGPTERRRLAPADLADRSAAAKARTGRREGGPSGDRGPVSRRWARRGRGARRSTRQASRASRHTARPPPRRQGSTRRRNGLSRAAQRISSL